ncbi:MAG TPA: hypothetical protein VM389_13325, partial [Phycisphaerae bacterium]|nr:hypothetical protein [Phycisphaerae bacterium]
DQGGVIYKLVGGKAGGQRPKTAMKVEETDDLIRVDTGAAQFEINRKRFNLLDKVVVDGRTVVESDPKGGSVVTDPEGRKYYGSAGTEKVRVLESGPVMVKVLAQGRHVSDAEGAFQPALYGYEVFLTFHAGQATVDVDAILTNNFAQCIGEPHFDDWSILTPLAGVGGQWSFRTLGGKPVTVAGGAGESAVLYQDSVGTEHWKTNVGLKEKVPYGKKPKGLDLSTFRGYKLWHVRGGQKEEEAAGDFADGVVACEAGGAGVTLSPRYFWQQFPSAVGFGFDGVVRLSPFPGEYKVVHWLEDASAKGQEFQLCFFTKEPAAAVATGKRYQKRVFALPSPKHCGDAGALSDIGPYRMHPKIEKAAREHFSLARNEAQALEPGGGYRDCYGWQVFGLNWIERAGVSGTNYEPLATSNHLWMHLLNANPDRLESGMRIARHARDVRAYHIEGRDNLALWKTWKPDYWNHCVIEHFSRMIPGAIEQTTYRPPDWLAHPYQRQMWPLPNMQHMNLDEVHDLYLMTGDDRALRCMRTIADHAVAWATLCPRPRRVFRQEGWCLRAVARYYEITHDKRYEPYLKEAIDQVWADVNKAGPWNPRAGTWYQAIYARGCAAAWLATGDERMRDLAIGCADWAMTYEWTPKGYPSPSKRVPPWTLTPEERVGPNGQPGMCPAWANGYHIDLYAWAYWQTGDRKYLPAMDFAWEKNANEWWLGYFPTAMYMAYGPRPDKAAPAAVTDLAGRASGRDVTLTWTAPGDDAEEGAAAVYQIKTAAKPMLDFVPFPGKMDTHITFWGSDNVANEPAPKQAGAKQSYVVKGLAPGKHWFAIKSRDECSNQSPISNVVAVEVK